MVDLSGGLDSRMVSWVANDMGYKEQLNISYCKEGYYDEKISKEIAKYLNHEYIFKYLDDKNFYMILKKLQIKISVQQHILELLEETGCLSH